MNTNKLGHFDFKQGGDGSGIAVFSSEAFAVIMPIRNTVADPALIAWAREALPAPVAEPLPAPVAEPVAEPVAGAVAA